MWSSSLLLILAVSSLSVYGQDCSRVHFLPLRIEGRTTVHFVRFNSQPCNGNFDYMQSQPFCEISNWGDEEASVVCRSQLNRQYGIGGYLEVEPTEIGYSHVSCAGNEERLEECTVGNFTSHNCSEVGIVFQCFNVPLLLVSKTDEYETFQYIVIFENEVVEFCIILWGPVTETVHVLVEMTDSGSALADYDYQALSRTITFEPSNMMRSHQCVQIEIIDDSLAEDWERFTVLLSTNSSAVNLTLNKFDVFIHPSDDSCTEGSVTVVSDVYNSSLQLVEMCSSEGVWSPVCDNNWTLLDATVVCRELGYKDNALVYDSLDRQVYNIPPTAFECIGNEDTFGECSQTQLETVCQYVVVQCDDREDVDSDDGDDGNYSTSPDDKGNSSNIVHNDSTIGGNGDNSDGNSGDDRDSGEDSDGDSGKSGDGKDSGDNDSGESGDDKDSAGNSDGDSGDSEDRDSGDDSEGGNGGDNGDNVEMENSNTTDSENTEERTPEVNQKRKGDGASIGIFSGVVAAVLVAIALVLLGAVVLVYRRRKNKHINTTTAEDASELQNGGGKVGEKHLDNPTYNSSLDYPPPPEADEAVEHHVVNPLYDMAKESNHQHSAQYAILECPDYAVPDDAHIPTSPSAVTASPTPEVPDVHDYDYADTPSSDSKPV